MRLTLKNDDSYEEPLVVGSVQSLDEESENEELVGTSKFKRIASQCCGVLASDCLRFTTSSFSGFHILLIAELHKAESEIPVTLDVLTWIASLNFLVPLGSIANAFVAQRIGSRVVMLFSTVLFITTWLIYHYATTATMVLIGRMIYSFTSGAVKTPSSTYITEISQPHLRGSFLASSHLAATFGAFFSLLMGNIFYWRTIALINIVFPILTFVIVFLTPDSPIWLASKGRLNDAEVALCWLRGWVKPNHIQSEYQKLVDSIHKLSVESVRPMSSGKFEGAPSRREKWKKMVKPYLDRSFYLPLATISLIYTLHSFSGVNTVQTYSAIIFRKMNSPMDESLATTIMGAMRIVGAFIILFCIHRAGKRKLVFSSLIVAGLSYLTIFIVGYKLERGELEAETLSWISPIALIIAVFANASGVETIVHMFNSEIFPVSIRYIGSAIGSSICSIMFSIMSKSFLYAVDGITLPGVFLYFALVNATAFVVYYFVFPETEGRSLQDIENHFRGVKNLNDAKN